MSNLNKYNSQSGFLALMSAIIISAVLLIVVFSVSFSGFMTRFNILDSEYKIKSHSLAENYANEALLKLAKNLATNPSYGGETVNVSATDYYSIGSPLYTIKTRSVYNRATTNIKITATYSGGNLTINSWEEVPSF